MPSLPSEHKTHFLTFIERLLQASFEKGWMHEDRSHLKRLVEKELRFRLLSKMSNLKQESARTSPSSPFQLDSC
jgi:hypothetical protein